MELIDIPFCAIDWSLVEPSTHTGASGGAIWRTVQAGRVRVRVIEYLPGYVADHWCQKGHVVFVVEGELVTDLRDGRSVTLRAGQSYVVADGDGAHMSRAPMGARLFIVD